MQDDVRTRREAGALVALAAALLVCCVRPAHAHGRLTEPPSRASAWRFGFDTPHNYNDHELYCGGFTRQWSRNGGKCGVCGDPWDAPTPRAHELGGRFGKGVIVRAYRPEATIAIKVQLTASHNGYFEFRVCDEPQATTQECLDRHVLALASGRGNRSRFYPRDGSREYDMQYELPAGLECGHCVLQWRYIAGNNWGDCGNGTGAVGCGRQEEFRACADIAIGERFLSTTRRPHPSYVPPSRRPAPPGEHDAAGDSESGGAWLPALVASLALLCALALFAVLYLYYYRGGERIKSLLASRALSGTVTPPVAPPRQKRNSFAREAPPPLGGSKLQYADPGFENVDLRGQ